MPPGSEVEGQVEQILPRGLFRVRLASGQVVRASLSSQARRVVVKLLAGDRVLLQLHPNDPNRGRITRQL